jgi:uncharacterized spore protein YtfJ
MSGSAPLRVETVRGEAYEIDGRTLIPIVRIVSWGRARATIGHDRVGGWGTGFVWIRPLAMVETTPQGDRRIPITDTTAAAVRGLLGVALIVALFCTTIRCLTRRRRAGCTD